MLGFSLLNSRSSFIFGCILYQLCILQILCHTLACLCILLTVSFAEQKFLFFFFLSPTYYPPPPPMGYPFGIISKMLPNLRSPRPFSMLSSKSFIALCFTLKSLNHFEFIFERKMKFASRFIFTSQYPLVPSSFVEEIFFS